MLNTTRHAIWRNHFPPLIIVRSSTNLIISSQAGMDGLDRATGQRRPIVKGTTC